MDIVVDQITKKYGNQKAVDNLNFTVKTGEILGFLGPNGAGKSTTMKAITCYLELTDGDIRVGGASVRENPDEVKKHIGYLPESNPLYTDMPIVDYLAFCARLQGVAPERVPDRVGEMIRTCGISREKHKKIRELSKGYRQRVGLAQALIHDPEVLILDEPTTGLDPNQIVEIRELIRNIGREKTVILSSHILAEVEATCDRILIINKGQIVADGAAEQLRSQAQGDDVFHIQLRGTDPARMLEGLQTLSSVKNADPLDADNRFRISCTKGADAARDIFTLCMRNSWYISEMIPFKTTLEDVFRELTIN
ncbi:MAG: ATP-binding cassette domain-containing protein [Bacteroidales bacterium]|jgi:ABC-2 type transport system ATP-binding protein|nr:ATP-binding cassette domain-containing protein [Bacteroidales bacterium]